jgi:hypothetical protein
LPVIASTARGLAEQWMPAGDQAIIATRAYDVFGAHTPLVGQYSLLSALTGHLTYSPGPMLYWLIALPARFGSPHAIALVVGLANALAVIAIVALARARGGTALMLACAAAVALMCRSFMPEALHDNWNPSAGLLPLTLLAFLCWSLACGERRMLPAVALVASFTAQCQVAFLAPTVALVLIGLIGPARTRRTERAGGGRLWPWGAGALSILALCWALPVLDQLEHDPGNLASLYEAATHPTDTMGAQAGARAVVRAVGVPPRWLRLPSDPFDTRLADAVSDPGALSTITAIAILAALLLLATLGAWRRRADVAWAAAIGLVLCLAFAAVAAGTPVASRKVLGYTLWWGSIVGMWVWLSLGWGVAVLAAEMRLGPRAGAAMMHLGPRVGAAMMRLGPRVGAAMMRLGPSVAKERSPAWARPGWRGGLWATACAYIGVLAVASSISVGQTGDAHRAEYGPIASIASQLDRARLPGPGATVLLRASLGGATSPLSQAIKFLLRRHGMRILQRGARARLGGWYEPDHRRYDRVVYAYDGKRAPDRRASLLARAAVGGQRAREIVTVTISRGEPYPIRAITRPRLGGRGPSNTHTVRRVRPGDGS